jgi:hypothetical protein
LKDFEKKDNRNFFFDIKTKVLDWKELRTY